MDAYKIHLFAVILIFNNFITSIHTEEPAIKSWNYAFKECRDKGENLPVPTTKEEYDLVKELMKFKNISRLWTGMRIMSFHQPKWIDGTMFEQAMKKSCGVLDILATSIESDICEQVKNGYFCAFPRAEDCPANCKLAGKLCSSHVIGEECVMAICDEADWLTAWKQCKSMDGQLAMAKTYQKQVNLYEASSSLQKHCRKLWIGLNMKRIIYFNSTNNDMLHLFPVYTSWPLDSWKYANACIAISKEVDKLVAVPCHQTLKYDCVGKELEADIYHKIQVFYQQDATDDKKQNSNNIAFIVPVSVVGAIILVAVVSVLIGRKAFQQKRKKKDTFVASDLVPDGDEQPRYHRSQERLQPDRDEEREPFLPSMETREIPGTKEQPNLIPAVDEINKSAEENQTPKSKRKSKARSFSKKLQKKEESGKTVRPALEEKPMLIQILDRSDKLSICRDEVFIDGERYSSALTAILHLLLQRLAGQSAQENLAAEEMYKKYWRTVVKAERKEICGKAEQTVKEVLGNLLKQNTEYRNQLVETRKPIYFQVPPLGKKNKKVDNPELYEGYKKDIRIRDILDNNMIGKVLTELRHAGNPKI